MKAKIAVMAAIGALTVGAGSVAGSAQASSACWCPVTWGWGGPIDWIGDKIGDIFNPDPIEGSDGWDTPGGWAGPTPPAPAPEPDIDPTPDPTPAPSGFRVLLDGDSVVTINPSDFGWQ